MAIPYVSVFSSIPFIIAQTEREKKSVILFVCFPVISYLEMLEWIMDSVAYYIRPYASVMVKPSCGFVDSSAVFRKNDFLIIRECNIPHNCDYLCEVRTGTYEGSGHNY